MPTPAIEATGISKQFFAPLDLKKMARFDFSPAGPVAALRDVSFAAEEGKALGVLGLNGAGKTTLLKILATLIIPDTGSARVNGCLLGRDDERIKACVGLVALAERSFYWRLNGRQNLEFFAALYGLDKSRARHRIDELLDFFAVDYDRRPFYTYSAGMRQRFALARALLHDPGILLLDEPTKSLDYRSTASLRTLIKEELVGRQHKTVIFTTHQMEEARELGDSFLILEAGAVKATGGTEILPR